MFNPLDNASLASDALLDRLNSLLEPNGTLSLNERGNVNGEIVTLKPHPDFRLFLSVNPSSGDLSRPLRNRGLELFIEPPNLSLERNQAALVNRCQQICRDKNASRQIVASIQGPKISLACLSASKLYAKSISLGVKKSSALKSALELGHFLSGDLGIETKSEEFNELEPISLPLSNHLVQSPTSFTVANFIALCLAPQITSLSSM